MDSLIFGHCGHVHVEHFIPAIATLVVGLVVGVVATRLLAKR